MPRQKKRKSTAKTSAATEPYPSQDLDQNDTQDSLPTQLMAAAPQSVPISYVSDEEKQHQQAIMYHQPPHPYYHPNAIHSQQPAMETPEGSNETGVPFTCTICDKSFWRKYDFKRHVRIHTNERPYVCPRCEKGFTRKDALNRHLQANTKCAPIGSKGEAAEEEINEILSAPKRSRKPKNSKSSDPSKATSATSSVSPNLRAAMPTLSNVSLHPSPNPHEMMARHADGRTVVTMPLPQQFAAQPHGFHPTAYFPPYQQFSYGYPPNPHLNHPGSSPPQPQSRQMPTTIAFQPYPHPSFAHPHSNSNSSPHNNPNHLVAPASTALQMNQSEIDPSNLVRDNDSNQDLSQSQANLSQLLHAVQYSSGGNPAINYSSSSDSEEYQRLPNLQSIPGVNYQNIGLLSTSISATSTGDANDGAGTEVMENPTDTGGGDTATNSGNQYVLLNNSESQEWNQNSEFVNLDDSNDPSKNEFINDDRSQEDDES